MKDRNGQRRRRRSFWGRENHRSVRPRPYRPRFEALESRVVLTAFVTSIDPGPNTQVSPATTGIGVTFDQDINGSTVSDSTFAIHGSQWGQFVEAQSPTQLFSASGSAIEYSPGLGVDFQPGELVQVTPDFGNAEYLRGKC